MKIRTPFLPALASAALVAGAFATPLVGTGSVEHYCDATPNSAGTIARIDHVGSLDLADGSFGLRTTGLPNLNGSFGMFTCGIQRANIPFGNGVLCIQPFHPGLYRMTVQAIHGTTIQLTSTESPSDFSLCTPGSTWNFQFWYRDPAGGPPRFNLSDAIGVTFAP